MNEYTITVTIPIRSYLKKFIAGSREVEPFRISHKRCHFSAVILEPLSKEEIKLKDKNIFLDKLRWNDSLLCCFDAETLREKKFWISSESAISIDFRLKEMFDQQLIDFININHKKGVTIEDNILKFLDYFDITDDDLTLETAQKMYYRARYPKQSKSLKKSKEVIQAQKTLFD